MIDGVALAGLSELRYQLRQIDRDLPKQILTPTLRAAAEPMVAPARLAAPVGETGKLRRTVRLLASQRRVALAAGTARVPYAPYVHHGTKHMAANPWLDRVADAQRQRVADRISVQLAIEMSRRGLDTS